MKNTSLISVTNEKFYLYVAGEEVKQSFVKLEKNDFLVLIDIRKYEKDDYECKGVFLTKFGLCISYFLTINGKVKTENLIAEVL